ncbi:putative bromodomain protein [Trichinella spiralis]|uniref:putative bromodomain protein n=1 Tax=Trichinella spiralis TaxID=6334 RepID=UPI0001EFB75A|nr:putative bromodomain protein [Trichinella spiralis]
MKLDHVTAYRLLSDLKGKGPPFVCPIDNCGSSYKSFSGIRYHFKHAIHETLNKKKTPLVCKNPKEDVIEHQHDLHSIYEVDISGIDGKFKFQLASAVEKRISFDSRSTPNSGRNHTPLKRKDLLFTPKFERAPKSKLGNAVGLLSSFIVICVNILNSLFNDGLFLEHLPHAECRPCEEAPPKRSRRNFILSKTYIKCRDVSYKDLIKDVTYDLDEEDNLWLKLINDKRKSINLAPINKKLMEFVMDRLEKVSYFEVPSIGQGPPVDEDAVCCVCNDGDCENTNVILFCDMCNMPVHQECYGVPYIPEGQWLCRRCQLSPARSVDCCLCPNRAGAVKQTNDGRWAHVACAMWIPEVQFANLVFLEPIEVDVILLLFDYALCLNEIPAARWKLVCYICKRRNVGACIQCQVPTCYTAFHVTCGLGANLYMKVEPVVDPSVSAEEQVVRKISYCGVHTPNEVSNVSKVVEPVVVNEEAIDVLKESSKVVARQARKVLAEKRSASYVGLLPVIPTIRLIQIANSVRMSADDIFFQRLVNFWMCKRYSRLGVPLLRGVQESFSTLLLFEMERMHSVCFPIKLLLLDLVNRLLAFDVEEVFAQPVSEEIVPGYRSIISNPMDLGTMRKKVLQFEYMNVNEFMADFNLMIANCLKFNRQNRFYLRIGRRMDAFGKKEIARALEEEKCLRKIASQCSEKDAFINDIKRELGICILRKRRSENDANNDHSIANAEITGNNNSVCDDQLSEVTFSTKLEENAAHFVSLVDETICADGVNLENTAADSTADNDVSMIDASKHSPQLLLSANALVNGQDASLDLSSAVVDRQQQHTGTGYRLNDDHSKANENNSDSSEVKFSDQEVKKRPGRPRKREASNPVWRPTRQKSLRIASALEASTTLNGTDEPSSTVQTSTLLNSVLLANSEAANYVLKTTNDDIPTSMDLQHPSDEPVSDEPIADEFVFEMLDLVWAKRSTMPWFPGMIVDPDMPRTGFTGKLADIPSPPEDVLQLKPNDGSYLVMLFNSMHTWNWLPKRCLKPLGLDISLDKKKVAEARKTLYRQSIAAAYKEAMKYRYLILGQIVAGNKQSKSAS